jgi:hypothetical protein
VSSLVHPLRAGRRLVAGGGKARLDETEGGLTLKTLEHRLVIPCKKQVGKDLRGMPAVASLVTALIRSLGAML